MKKLSIILALSLVLGLVVMANGEVMARDVVRISIQSEPSRLNPVTREDTEAGFVLSMIHDPLIELDSEGNYTTEGAVAEDYEISEDGTVYTFYIREGITFHDGNELTAEDVKFSYEQFMDEEMGSPHHSYYQGVEELNLLDDYTLEVVLESPDVAFLTTARLRGHVMPKEYIEDVGWEAYERNPVGSGPYRFVEHHSGSFIELERNEDFWHHVAEIPNLEFRFYPEISTAVMALEAKEIDFIAELPADEYNSLKNNPAAELKFGSFEIFQDHRIVFNKRDDSIFSDKRLRQAVAYAINREELIALTRGDLAVPAVGRVPGFHAASASNANAYEYNPDRARELLEEAGYPDGFETAIYAPSGYRERVMESEQIQQQLAEVGIQAEVVTLEWGTYLDATGEGEAPIFRERWSATAPDPFSFIENWHSESSWNPIFGVYHNEEVDELINQIRVETNTERRWELFREVQEVAMEDVPSYPLYWPIDGLAYNDQLNIPEDLFNDFRNPISHINLWSFE